MSALKAKFETACNVIGTESDLISEFSDMISLIHTKAMTRHIREQDIVTFKKHGSLFHYSLEICHIILKIAFDSGKIHKNGQTQFFLLVSLFS